MSAEPPSAAAAALATHWKMPQASTSLSDVWAKTYPLMMYNSLTRSKVRAAGRGAASIGCYAAH